MTADASREPGLLDVFERERRLTACEIHDGVVQDAVGALMILEAVTSGLPEHAAPLGERLTTAAQMLRRAIAEARRVMGELRPVELGETDLLTALGSLVAHEQSDGTLEIEMRCDVAPALQLPELLVSTVCRIVQESLRNVKRHAQTDQASVHIEQRAEEILVEVADAGDGFLPERVPPGHVGLVGIRERARLLGGEAAIRSAPDQGTSIALRLPLGNPTRHAPS